MFFLKRNIRSAIIAVFPNNSFLYILNTCSSIKVRRTRLPLTTTPRLGHPYVSDFMSGLNTSGGGPTVVLLQFMHFFIHIVYVLIRTCYGSTYQRELVRFICNPVEWSYFIMFICAVYQQQQQQQLHISTYAIIRYTRASSNTYTISFSGEIKWFASRSR